jgi:hypothetical protein
MKKNKAIPIATAIFLIAVTVSPAVDIHDAAKAGDLDEPRRSK